MPQNPDALVKFAVQDIVNQINAGSNPQEATEKVARALDLNPNFIKRAAEAINVALHYNHFKKHAEAKAEDFPIVDAQKIAENIFGQKEKTASETKSELFSSFQAEETTPKFARYLEEGPHKEAYEKIVSMPAETKTVMSEQGVYEKSANYLRDLKKTAEDKEAKAQEADFQVGRAFCGILEKFAKAPEARASFEEFESQAFSMYGEKAMPYVDLLHKTAHSKEARGTHDANYKLFTPCNEVVMLGSFLKQAEELASITKEAADTKYNYEFEKKYVDEIFQKRGCELHKQAEGPIDGSFLAKLEADMNTAREKVAQISEEDPVMAAVKHKKAEELKKEDERISKIAGLIDLALGPGADLYKGTKKPSLSATTNTDGDNRERAFLLQELATTDPILAKLPTNKVVDSYQQMLRIAPEMSKEKEVVRSFLRQSTAGQAIDPFTSGQLVEANSKLLQQRQRQMGIGGGGMKKDE